MFRHFALAALTTLGLTAATSTAQGPGFGPGFQNQGKFFGQGHHHYHVQYRQMHWREQSFSSLYEARQFANFKASQGFQTDIDRHGHHWDVRYRMPHWQTYRTVNSDAQAHSLEHMLEHSGYDARVVHH